MGAPCDQLDLFAAQGVPSYGDAFSARKPKHDQPASHAKRWHEHALETEIAEAEAAAEPPDLNDDENAQGEQLDEQVPERTCADCGTACPTHEQGHRWNFDDSREGYPAICRQCSGTRSPLEKDPTLALYAAPDEQVPEVDLHQLAARYWQLLDHYDTAMRAGDDIDPAWLEGMRKLEAEANGGSTCGIRGGRRDFPGPYRLRTLVKWRARREGRLPMWGLEQRFRFTCRGLHVIGNSGWLGLSLELDKDRHRPGDLCWSETGYRSFLGTDGLGHGLSPEAHAVTVLEAYIDDKPGKDGAGGLGGKLRKWVPYQARPWAQRERDRKGEGYNKPYDPEYRRQCPTCVPEEERPAYWAEWERKADEKAEAALASMEARGVDPYELFPDCKPPAQAALL